MIFGESQTDKKGQQWRLLQKMNFRVFKTRIATKSKLEIPSIIAVVYFSNVLRCYNGMLGNAHSNSGMTAPMKVPKQVKIAIAIN